jgi:deoxyribodipyrimidine photolyase-related protein
VPHTHRAQPLRKSLSHPQPALFLLLRTGETACPFTTLYWDFLDRHKDTFAKNHRMSQQIFGLKRLSDLPELKARAQEVIAGLQKGKI